MSWLGLARMPEKLADLSTSDAGLTAQDLVALEEDIAAARKTARSFTRSFVPQKGNRTLLAKGALASSRIAGPKAVTIWFFDATETSAEIARLTADVSHLSADFATISGLLEAAPFPMWHRGPDLRLMRVNSAYVRAVEAESAQEVVQRGLELSDNAQGLSPVQAAAEAMQSGQAVWRIVPATLTGERRTIRIVDVWDFEEDFLSGHPRVDALVEAIAPKLAAPERARLAGVGPLGHARAQTTHGALCAA